MPRIPRVVWAGVPHHVTQRGNRRIPVFYTDDDRKAYLKLLCEYAGKHAVKVLAYCLMTNHVHLVVVPETSDGLHRAFKPLHMRHAQQVNRAHGWNGHLWQGRFFSSILDDTYLWNAIRYVELNPVRARLVEKAEDYRWSSAGSHCSSRRDPSLTTDASWRRRFKAIGNWSDWLARGVDDESIELLRRNANKGLPCGSAAFVAGLERTTGRTLHERPRGRPSVPKKGKKGGSKGTQP